MKRLLPVLMGFALLLLSSTEGWSLPPKKLSGEILVYGYRKMNLGVRTEKGPYSEDPAYRLGWNLEWATKCGEFGTYDAISNLQARAVNELKGEELSLYKEGFERFVYNSPVGCDKVIIERIIAHSKQFLNSINKVKPKPPAPTKPAITPAQARDITPPTIQIASSIAVKEDRPTIRGRVSDNEKVVQVTVEGRAARLTSNGKFSFKRYVPPSGTKVTIEAPILLAAFLSNGKLPKD